MCLALQTLSTFSALVFTAVNVHMNFQAMLISKALTTLSAWKQLFSTMHWSVLIQISFGCKPFVTHRTHKRSLLVITWMHSDIIDISFNLHLKMTFICTIYNMKYTMLTAVIIMTETAAIKSNNINNWYCYSNDLLMSPNSSVHAGHLKVHDKKVKLLLATNMTFAKQYVGLISMTDPETCRCRLMQPLTWQYAVVCSPLILH